MNRIYIFETVSSFSMKYAIEADSEEKAFEIYKQNEYNDFAQTHLGEVIVDIIPVTEDEYIKLFDQDSEYLKNWSDDAKLNLVKRDVQD